MSPVFLRAPGAMPSALGVSLGLHLAVLQGITLPVSAEAPPPLVIETRLLAPEPPRKQASKPSATVPVPVRPTQAAQPLLAGGAAMSDEDDVAVSQQVALPTTSRLTANAAGGSVAVAAGGGAQAGAAGGEAARGSSLVASRALASSVTPLAAAPGGTGGGGGQAGMGDAAAARAEGGAPATRALARAGVAGGSRATPAAASAAVSAEGGGGQTVLHGLPRTAALGAAAAPAVVRAGGEAGVAASTAADAALAQRIDLAHAERAAAHLADAVVRGRPAAASGGSLGGEPSGESRAQRNPGPPSLPSRLLQENAAAVDFAALPQASGRLFKAALGADGEACFSYTPRMRRLQQQGLVVLRVQVGRDGQATRIEIKQGSGNAALDAAAQEQARGCARFVLQDRRGQPVAASIDLPIRYRLLEDH